MLAQLVSGFWFGMGFVVAAKIVETAYAMLIVWVNTYNTHLLLKRNATKS